MISVNQEAGDTAANCEAVLKSYKPDFVCGYIHHSWIPMIGQRTKSKAYPYALDSDRPSFVVKSDEWMQQVLADIYANLDDRKLGAKIFNFPATFRP